MHSVKNYARGMVLALFFMTLGSLLAHGSVNAAPPGKSTAPARGYYLTPSNVNGNLALTACVAGFRMASFAEISDPSNLTYDTAIGRTAPDSGFGPPSYTAGAGWVRSGFSANTDPTNLLIPTNCNLWTSSSGSDHGEVAFPVPAIGVMNFTNTTKCDNSEGLNIGVWCVQD